MELEVEQTDSFLETLFLYFEGIKRKYTVFLDKAVPYVAYRWIFLLVVAIFYAFRVLTIHGFHIVTYALGIYFLNIFISFLSPQVSPHDLMDELEDDAPTLPTKSDDEFRPFVRRLPEFKFWHNSIRAFLLAMFCTFFPFLDVPVFWPILLIYWALLAFFTLKQQIRHMIKYRYVPFTIGKPTFQDTNKGEETTSPNQPRKVETTDTTGEHPQLT